MVFHWSLSDSKSAQVSRIRLSILAILSNAVVWIVSTRPLTSKSSRPFNNPLVTVPNAPITIGTIVTFMFHSFFNSRASPRHYYYYYYYYYYYLLLESFSYQLTLMVFHCHCLSDSKSPQVFRTLLSILSDLDDWMLFGWSRLVLFPSPVVPLLIIFWPYKEHQLQLVRTPLSCSTVFFNSP